MQTARRKSILASALFLFLSFDHAHCAIGAEQSHSWNFPIKLAPAEITGTVTLGAAGWTKTFSISGTSIDLKPPVPSATDLKDYDFRGVTLKQVLIVPLFDSIYRTPIVTFNENGRVKTRQVVLSTDPLEPGDMCGRHGRTIHYFVYSAVKQRVQFKLLLTDVDIQLSTGWNIVYDTSEFIAPGTKIRASPRVATNIDLYDAPADGWIPTFTALPF